LQLVFCNTNVCFFLGFKCKKLWGEERLYCVKKTTGISKCDQCFVKHWMSFDFNLL
jgi:hypothetical protein